MANEQDKASRNPYVSPRHHSQSAHRRSWTILDLIRVNSRAIILGALAGIVFTVMLFVFLIVFALFVIPPGAG